MASSVVNSLTLLALLVLCLSLVTAAPRENRALSPRNPTPTPRNPATSSPVRTPTPAPKTPSPASVPRGSAHNPAARVELAPTPTPTTTSGPAHQRADHAPLTKTFDQRQQGTTNIQAHLDNIVVILVPSNRISITDFAAKTEPEFGSGKPVNKLFQSLSELKSAPTSIEAQSAEFFNSIPESKARPEVEKKQPEAIAGKEEEEKAEKKPVQMDGAAKKFPFQLDTRPLEIPVLVIQDP